MTRLTTNLKLPDVLGTGVVERIGGKDYRLCPLTLGDMAELQQDAESWVASDAERRAALVRRLTPGDAGEAEAAGILADAKGLIAGENVADVYVSTSRIGVTHALWLSMRHELPDLTRADVAALVPDGQSGQLMATVYRVTYPPRPGAGKPADKPAGGTAAGGTDPNGPAPATAPTAATPGQQPKPAADVPAAGQTGEASRPG